MGENLLNKLATFSERLKANAIFIPENSGEEIKYFFDLWTRNTNMSMAISRFHNSEIDAKIEVAEKFIAKLEDILIGCKSENTIVMTSIVLKFLNCFSNFDVERCGDNEKWVATLKIEGKICYSATRDTPSECRVEVSRQFMSHVMDLLHPHYYYRNHSLNLINSMKQRIQELMDSGDLIIFTMKYCYHCQEQLKDYLNNPDSTIIYVDQREDMLFIRQALEETGIVYTLPAYILNGNLIN